VRARMAFTRHWSESAVLPRYLDVVRTAAERSGRTRVAAALAEPAADVDLAAGGTGPARRSARP
jgi:hypothetical protein